MGIVVETGAFVAAELRREPDSSGTPLTWDSLLGGLADEGAVLPAAAYAELVMGEHLAGNDAEAAARRARIDALVARVPANDLTVAPTALKLDFPVLAGRPFGEGGFRRVAGLVEEQL